MHDIVAVDKEERFGDLDNNYLQLGLIFPHSLDELFVFDLH